MLRTVFGLMAALSLAACLASGILVFLGCVESETYRRMLSVASLAWFVFAAAWSGKSTRPLETQGEADSSER